jgi:hypothetical protein
LLTRLWSLCLLTRRWSLCLLTRRWSLCFLKTGKCKIWTPNRGLRLSLGSQVVGYTVWCRLDWPDAVDSGWLVYGLINYWCPVCLVMVGRNVLHVILLTISWNSLALFGLMCVVWLDCVLSRPRQSDFLDFKIFMDYFSFRGYL